MGGTKRDGAKRERWGCMEPEKCVPNANNNKWSQCSIVTTPAVTTTTATTTAATTMAATTTAATTMADTSCTVDPAMTCNLDADCCNDPNYYCMVSICMLIS